MQRFFNDAKRILSHKWTGFVFIGVALGVKISMQIYFFRIIGDKSSQLVAAKNLLAGHGLTINKVLLTDLSDEKFFPLVGWPPGYSLVLSPLLWLFNNDYETAALFFDIACVIPFFFYLFRLLNYLSLQAWLRNLFILFAGFFFYPVGAETCTDFISLSCILAGVYYFLRLMNDDKKSIWSIAAACISLSLAGIFRYNYIPVSLCFPVLLGIAGIANKNKQWIKYSFYTGIILSILMLSLLAFQFYHTGSIAYLNSKETGFFPKNLLQMYPIMPASFFDIQTGLTVFTKITGSNYTTNGNFLKYSSYILLLLLLTYSLYWIYNKKMILEKRTDSFAYLGIGISAVTIILLFYLSVRNSSDLAPFFPFWTYVQEYRYFVFIIIFIQLATFVFLLNRYKQLSFFWKRIALLCTFLIFLQLFHKVFYVSKIMMNKKQSVYSRALYKEETVSLIELIKDIQNQNPGYEIIVASPQHEICNYARLENIKAAFIAFPFDPLQQITSTVPSKILYIIPASMVPYFNPLLSSTSLKHLGVVRNRYFYIYDVEKKQ